MSAKDRFNARIASDEDFRDEVAEKVKDAAYGEVLRYFNFGGDGAEVSSEQVDELHVGAVTAVGEESVGDGVTSLDVHADLDVVGGGLVDHERVFEFGDDPGFEVTQPHATETDDQIQMTREMRGHFNVIVDDQSGDLVEVVEMTHGERR